ncbi:MAG TPA: carbonic anhydrase [Planktothrix sp.]
MVEELARGHRRFREKLSRDAHEQKVYSDLARGQKPEILVLHCSDSRLDMRIFSSQPGEIFAVQNAGNLLPPLKKRGAQGEWSTIEFALNHLPIRCIVVLGHTDCGYCGAVMNRKANFDKTPSLKRWVKLGEPVRRITMCKHGHLTGTHLVNAAVKENALYQLEQLRSHPTIAEKVKEGTLSLAAMYFDVGLATVFHYNENKGEFVALG